MTYVTRKDYFHEDRNYSNRRVSSTRRLVNEVIKQRKAIDTKFMITVFQEKILYTALIILED